MFENDDIEIYIVVCIGVMCKSLKVGLVLKLIEEWDCVKKEMVWEVVDYLR